MKTPLEIKAILAQCTGSEGYHFNAITRAMGMVYTDGVKIMAEMCEAYWLLHKIASLQPCCMQDPMLQEFQSWTIIVDGSPDGNHMEKATLKCERDTDDVFHSEKLEHTDFPLSNLNIYMEPGYTSFGDGKPLMVMVMMLASER